MSVSMSCSLCDRTGDLTCRLFCHTCSRSKFYDLRFKLAQALIEKEIIRQRVESSFGKPVIPNFSTLQIFYDTRSRTIQLISKVKGISYQIQILRILICEKKKEIEKHRKFIVQHQSNIRFLKHEIREKQLKTFSHVRENRSLLEQTFGNLHSKIVESRNYLCREAADLYRLRQHLPNGQQTKPVYTIGGIEVPDLREMNGLSHAQLTTALLHAAQLLVLVSQYLSLQLPAEVTLPHRDYPLLTISPPSNSHRSFYDSVYHKFCEEPLFSRISFRAYPQQRRLSLHKKLFDFAQEDPAACAMFFEGVALLAWDVLWVCCTQGSNLNQENKQKNPWEIMCNVGENMWSLLVLNNHNPGIHCVGISGYYPYSTKRFLSLPILGHLSHGTAHSFLGASDSSALTTAWGLHSPGHMVEHLNWVLSTEMANGEWELLDHEDSSDKNSIN